MIIKKLFTLVLAATIGFALNAQAQKITKFGDDVSTLNGIVKAFYDVTCVKKGQQSSYERDSLLHWPGALVGLSAVNKTGKPVMLTMTLKGFHDMNDAEMAQTGYHERQIAQTVEQFGNIYHVWSTYETRYVADGPLIGRGIDSIQLYFDGTRFWILGWFGDSERKGVALPKEYLPK